MTTFVFNNINWKFVWYIQRSCSVNSKNLDLELKRASETGELYLSPRA